MYEVELTDLYVVAAMVEAAFSEEPVSYRTSWIELVKHRVGILGVRLRRITVFNELATNLAQTRRKHDHLVQLAHLTQEIVHAGPLQDVKVVPVVLDLNRHDVVRGRYGLWRTDRECTRRDRSNVARTLKLLCTNVSSRSSTRHLRPRYLLAMAGNSGRGVPSWRRFVGIGD